MLIVSYSCSNNTSQNSNNTENNNGRNAADISESNTATTENIYDQFAKTDYGGKDFTMLLVDYLSEEHDAETLTGDVFNDAVYNRNQKIEADYNINMNFVTKPLGDINNEFTKSVMAGDGAYDVAAIHAVDATSMFTNGVYADWNNVPTIKENLTQPWWNQSAVKDLSIGNKTFFIAGDIGYLYIAQNHAFIFNKKLFGDAGMEIPYNMVENGTWTFDAFQNLIKSCNRDLNGDGKMDINNDMFGFATMTYFADTMYFYNFGGKIVDKDANDYPVLVLNSEKNANIINAGYQWFITGNCPITPYLTDDYTQETAHIAFKNDRVYILGTNLKNLRVLRDMNSEYGILPYPKFDSTQPDYISCVEGAATVLVLPKTADFDFTGTICEALARESSLTVIPAYYETTLQQKFARDEETINMLNIIRKTATFDMGYIYNIGGAGFIGQTLLAAKSTDLASYCDKHDNAIQAAIDKLVAYSQKLS